jgi:cyclopropane fatty-acyl-phospholipid synthase-like methyltransferase
MLSAQGISEEIARKNSELYDETSGPLWHLAVYEPVHDGWEFINLGGKPMLDAIARRAKLKPGQAVLEMCSGQGATCRFLAERYGCEVTGVEMNPRQVERARMRLSEVSSAIAGRVRIVEGNVLDWRSPQPFDAVVSIDSTMLIEDLPRVIDNAYQSLRPGGSLSVATIVAGSQIDKEFRRFAWEADGMISLFTTEEYRGMFRAAEFTQIESEDFTHLAVESSLKIAEALEECEDRIVRAEGEEVYRGWVEVGQIYLNAFREGKLGYQLIAGRCLFNG